MKSKTTTTTGTQVSVTHETAKFALGVGVTMAVVIGIWGVASLVSALFSNGPGGLVKSYFGAVFGM